MFLTCLQSRDLRKNLIFYLSSLTTEFETFACKKFFRPYSTEKTHLQALSLPANAHQYEENNQIQIML